MGFLQAAGVRSLRESDQDLHCLALLAGVRSSSNSTVWSSEIELETGVTYEARPSLVFAVVCLPSQWQSMACCEVSPGNQINAVRHSKRRNASTLDVDVHSLPRWTSRVRDSSPAPFREKPPVPRRLFVGREGFRGLGGGRTAQHGRWSLTSSAARGRSTSRRGRLTARGSRLSATRGWTDPAAPA
jgi:hypothetical protein